MYKLSAHKTHEEANFLMETRWMLYMEDADTLHLFRVAPRAWFADGERIDLEGVRSYFGRIDARVRSHVGEGYIEATVTCDPERKPSRLAVRLPHPQGKKPEASIRLEYLSRLAGSDRMQSPLFTRVGIRRIERFGISATDGPSRGKRALATTVV